MKFSLASLGLGRRVWAALDSTPDGRLLAVKVKAPRTGRGLPVVLKCTESSGVAVGEIALQDIAHEVGAQGWTYPLPRGDYQMLVMAEPPVPEDELEQTLRWNLTSIIDYPVEEAVLSWMKIPTEEFAPDREKQLYVIVTRRSVVEEQASMFEKAKLSLKALDVRETALRNIAALIEQKQEGLGLVTVGATGVTTTFTYRGELYLDRFISQPLAEVLAGDQSRLQKFFDRLAQQVYQSMDLIAQTYPFINVSRIVLAPTPVRMDLAEQLRGKLPVPVEVLDLGKLFDLSATPQLLKPETQAKYLVALGAALRGWSPA